jgi:hypothetical protein
VDSSPAVWKKLGLDTDVGEVRVTWSDAWAHRTPSWILDGPAAMRGMEMPACGCVPYL